MSDSETEEIINEDEELTEELINEVKEPSLKIINASIVTPKGQSNFKCGKCNGIFYLSDTQQIIRCSLCGYRILYKLRTKNHIVYLTD
jgi:DNA-directed RNA polymerase subunit RPC12/RpoP